MSTVLVVGGDHIDGIKEALNQNGIKHINHWAGRKSADSHKVIPQNTRLIVLVTQFVNHSLMYSIKQYAAKRGLKVLYTGSNGASQLKMQLEKLGNVMVDACRKTYNLLLLKANLL
jgi:hypothetical protein